MGWSNQIMEWSEPDIVVLPFFLVAHRVHTFVLLPRLRTASLDGLADRLASEQVTGVADAHKIRHINMAGHMIKNIPLELTNAPPLLTLHLGYNLLQTINPRLFAMQVN